MGDIPQDGHLEAFEAAFLLLDGQQIQQGLGGVLMRAVPGVDHRGVGVPGDHLRNARRGMADHDDVDLEGFEILDGVENRLAFRDAGGSDGDVEDVRREPLGGQLKRRAGAGAGLEEEVDHRLAPQRRDFFDGTQRDFPERLGGGQEQANFHG